MNIMTAKLLDRICNTELNMSSSEISVLLTLANLQEQNGMCVGVHWRDITFTTGISKSGYYNARKELQEKGIITISKSDASDSDICIIENDVRELAKNIVAGTNTEKYIKLNMQMLHDKDFHELKANEKRLALMLVKRYTKANDGKYFYNPGCELRTYAEELKVKTRSVKEYFEKIKKWIVVSNDRVVNNKVKRIVSVLKRGIERPKEVLTSKGQAINKSVYAEFDNHKHRVKTFLRRCKITYDEQNLNDTAVLINQYKNIFVSEGENDTFTYIKRAILNSMNETLELSSSTVHKILSNISKMEKPKVIEKTDNRVEKSTSNKFNNFPQREYDYDDLEKELLGLT